MKFIFGTMLMLAIMPLATASEPLGVVYRAGLSCGHLEFEGMSYEAFEQSMSSSQSAPTTISGWIELIRKDVQEGQKKMEISETLLRSNTRTLNETDSPEVREKVQAAIQYLNERMETDRKNLTSSECILKILEG